MSEDIAHKKSGISEYSWKILFIIFAYFYRRFLTGTRSMDSGIEPTPKLSVAALRELTVTFVLHAMKNLTLLYVTNSDDLY
jgi:hypothetical protein